MGSTEDSDRKKRITHSNSVSSPSRKQVFSAASEDKKVDPGMLHYQNQKLAQQLEVQREEIHELEAKFDKLREKQTAYNETLIIVNRVWDQLMEDLELLSVHVNANSNGLKVLNTMRRVKDEHSKHPVPAEGLLLHRLLQDGAKDVSSIDDSSNGIEKALTARSQQTTKLLVSIVQAVEQQRSRNDELSVTLRKGASEADLSRIFRDGEVGLRGEVGNLRTAMEALHVRHREMASEVAEFRDLHARDEIEIKRLSDQLEDTVSELESSRRKLAALKQHKETAALPSAAPNSAMKAEGDKSGDKHGLREGKEMEAAVFDAEKLAGRRLKELEEAHKKHTDLIQQIRQLQTDQHVQSSRSYLLLKDQVHVLHAELEGCRMAVDQLQRERDIALIREKEMLFKAEAGDAARRASAIADARAQDLEVKLQQCMADRDTAQRRLEEYHKAAGRKETVAELKVMISTLHKEMNMMQSQLNKHKEAGHEVHVLRGEVHSLSSVLERKSKECQELTQKCSEHLAVIKELREEVKVLQESEQELKLFCDMFEHESTDSRDVSELKQAERRALAQAERLKAALDEHGLALRVKAANEAEAACQQRLASAEAEMVHLRQNLDKSERLVVELKETLQSKNEEGDAYISEIETIGQAYEDMQTQNQRLLQQILERDDYNTQLMSESVKAKQMQTSLQAEKEAMAARMQHTVTVADLQKHLTARAEEQAKAYLEQLGKAVEESRQVAAGLDTAKRRQQEAEREAATAKTLLESAQKEAEEQAMRAMELALDLERERFKRKRMEEDGESSGKMARSSSTPHQHHHQHERGVTVELLQEEIKEYKNILKCSVCHNRHKEVVITKCFHLFCSPCIQRNLEIRHRKCPACGVPFGASDVKNVYI